MQDKARENDPPTHPCSPYPPVSVPAASARSRTFRAAPFCVWPYSHARGADGSKFEGDFQNGKFQGHGIYLRADGMKFEGQFTDGTVMGEGLLTFADGSNGCVLATCHVHVLAPLAVHTRRGLLPPFLAFLGQERGGGGAPPLQWQRCTRAVAGLPGHPPRAVRHAMLPPTLPTRRPCLL